VLEQMLELALKEGRFEQVELHLRAGLFNIEQENGFGCTEAIMIGNLLIRLLRTTKRYDECEQLARFMLSHSEQQLGPNNVLTNQITTQLAGVLEASTSPTVDVLEASTSPTVDVLEASNSPTVDVQSQGPEDPLQRKAFEIVSLYRRVLESLELVQPEDSVLVIIAQTNLAAAMLPVVNSATPVPLELIRKALNSAQQRFGQASLQAMGPMHLLGRALARLHQHDQAEAVFRQMIEIFSMIASSADANGCSEINVTVESIHEEALVSLGEVLTLKKQYAAAEVFFEQAFKAVHKQMQLHQVKASEYTPRLIHVQQGLARTLLLQGKDEQAEPLLKELKSIMEKQLGLANRRTLMCCCELGCTLRRLGRYEDALVLYKELLMTCHKWLDSHHPFTICAANNIALVMAKQGRYADAQKLYQATRKYAVQSKCNRAQLAVLESNWKALVAENPQTEAC
jgi:tetratricopeptide (TPR) repeat protein